MQRMRRLIGGALVVVLMAACGDDDDVDDADGSATTTDTTEAEDVAEAEAGGAEPPDPCTFVDPQVVADAAGLTVDVTDQDGSSDVDLGSFATRSCSYANGQMTVSTLTFANVDDVRADFVANAENAGGTVLSDVDLGTLPTSTLVTEVSGLLSVNVLAADQPFGVGFTTLDDPAKAIAAAEAVQAATD